MTKPPRQVATTIADHIFELLGDRTQDDCTYEVLAQLQRETIRRLRQAVEDGEIEPFPVQTMRGVVRLANSDDVHIKVAGGLLRLDITLFENGHHHWYHFPKRLR